MRRSENRGQAAAELAILLPVLALIVLGALDLGRVFSVWLTLSNATREGARYVASNPTKSLAEITQVTRADITEQGLPGEKVAVFVDPSTRAAGRPVTVTARYSMYLITTYLFGAHPIAISGQTRMVVLPGKAGGS